MELRDFCFTDWISPWLFLLVELWASFPVANLEDPTKCYVKFHVWNLSSKVSFIILDSAWILELCSISVAWSNGYDFSFTAMWIHAWCTEKVLSSILSATINFSGSRPDWTNGQGVCNIFLGSWWSDYFRMSNCNSNVWWWRMEVQIYIGAYRRKHRLIGLSSNFHGSFIFNQASRRSCSERRQQG